MTNIYEFSVTDISGEQVSLANYQGKVILIVNTASKCGFTPQYKGLQELYDRYGEQDFVILGFPCNQFSNQEPGDEKQISEFCELNYGVSFPMFAKVDINGKNAEPLFNHLKNKAPGFLGTKNIKWNFTKFLIGRDGRVIKRYSPTDTPKSIEKDIVQALAD